MYSITEIWSWSGLLAVHESTHLWRVEAHDRVFVYTVWACLERVWFRRLRWHTRVQKLGKCPPPACMYEVFDAFLDSLQITVHNIVMMCIVSDISFLLLIDIGYDFYLWNWFYRCLGTGVLKHGACSVASCGSFVYFYTIVIPDHSIRETKSAFYRICI